VILVVGVIFFILRGSERRRDTADLSGLALLRSKQAKHDEAEKLARQSLALARRKYPTGNLQIGKAAMVLGHVLEEQGNYPAGIPVLEEAIGILGASARASAEHGTAVLYLGNGHFYAGKYEMSEKLK